MYTISYYTYGLRGQAVNEFNDLGALSCAGQSTCMFPTGAAALAQYDMVEDSYYRWLALLYLLAFLGGINLIAAFALTFLNFRAKVKEQPPNFEIQKAEKQASRAVLTHGTFHYNSAQNIDNESKIDVEQQQPVSVVFRKINYDVDLKTKDKSTGKPEVRRLLKDCYGYAKQGQLIALMGPSVS
jgi:hypothetical protein